jgi:hypothetical protein
LPASSGSTGIFPASSTRRTGSPARCQARSWGVRSFHPAPVPWPVAREGSVEWVASLRRRGG